ncbi:MAG: helix-turn-helix domain-containing protein [Candidatus Bathyarchaeota archaeon]|nr:helix-turn-helix domain-containing protein [Candidatus Bathyarchaeota archaeon]
MSLLEEGALAGYKILAIRPLPKVDPEKDLEWLCKSLGFLEPRDKRKTAFRILKLLLEAACENRGLTSDELAAKLSSTRGTMVHHLNKMIRSGLVIYHEGKYKLRGRSLKTTIEEMQRDINRVFEDLCRIAESVDKSFNLFSRS